VLGSEAVCRANYLYATSGRERCGKRANHFWATNAKATAMQMQHRAELDAGWLDAYHADCAQQVRPRRTLCAPNTGIQRRSHRASLLA
jgi:hypothetical protein